MNIKLRKIQVSRKIACCSLLLLLLAMSAAGVVRAQVRTEYRAFWVDTFNTALNNHADVVAVVNNARAARANALFVQVRRRGDSWYLNSLEPRGDRTPIQAGFDPLQDMIDEAHAHGIEVHASTPRQTRSRRARTTGSRERSCPTAARASLIRVIASAAISGWTSATRKRPPTRSK
jgi:uncharacterized lipoprotein YddW (UPF0748 family)